MNRKVYLPLLLLFVLFVKNSLYTPVPTEKKQLLFFSNQSQIDLKRSLLKTFKKAQKSIFISVYTLTDSAIIHQLNQTAALGVKVELIVDKKQMRSLRKKLSNDIKLSCIKQRGLMHQKIFIIDDITYIGSSNLTTSSLRMHDNLMLGLYNPQLADKIEQGIFNQDKGVFPILEENFEFYTLPSKEALERLLTLIDGAKKTIHIAMFTFTHQEVLGALKRAQARGVKVLVVLDYLSHKGASKKLAAMLKEASIPVSHNRGMQLMHHKFGFFDNELLIMGSTNWTKSAFEKNQDCLLILPNLKKADQKFMKKLWRNLWWESKKI